MSTSIVLHLYFLTSKQWNRHTNWLEMDVAEVGQFAGTHIIRTQFTNIALLKMRETNVYY